MNKKILITLLDLTALKYIKKNKNCFFLPILIGCLNQMLKKIFISKVIHANKFIKDHLKIFKT